MPKVFTRIGVGIVISLLGMASLLLTDITGHILNKTNAVNHTQCMFRTMYLYEINNTILDYPHLNMHWAVLIAPSLCLSIGPCSLQLLSSFLLRVLTQ